MARRLIVEIVGDSKSLERSFARSSAASRKFDRSMGRSTRGAIAGSGAFRSLGTSVAFASGAFLGGAGLGAAVSGAFGELNEGRRVAAQTNAVLRSTGEVAGVTAAQVDALGDSLMRKTGIDDEQIKSTENMLLTFTNVRNEVGATNDIFTQATQIALDMSVALGTDSTQAAIRLGKALQDPVKGVTALRRGGVAFTEEQQNQIKSLVETGRVMDAQKIILRELTTEFGGSAAAAGNVQPWNRLRETIRNFSAEIAEDALPTIQKFTAELQKFFDSADNRQRIKNDLANITDTIRAIFELDFNNPPRWVDDMDRSFRRKVDDWKRQIRLLPGVRLFRSGPGVLDRAGGGGDFFALRPDNRAGPFGPGGVAGSALRIPRGVSGQTGRVLPGADQNAAIPFRTFQLAIAEATRSRVDDEREIKTIIAVLRQRLGRARGLGARTEIQEALNQYQGQLQGMLEQDAQDVRDAADRIKEKRRAARDAARDALDVLSSSLSDQVDALREQAERIRDAARRRREADIARRSQFETPLRLQLEAARAGVTPGEGDDRAVAAKVADAARKALKSGNLLMEGQIDAWNTLADALRGLDRETGTATTFHKQSVSQLTANLGLSADKRRELAGRLAQRSRTGTVPNEGTGAFGQPITVTVNHTTRVDGDVIERTVTKHQQVRKRRNPTQKRGPHGI